MERPLALLLLILVPTVGFPAADAVDKSTPPPIAQPPLGMETLFSTAGGLLIVLLLIFALAWAFKRYSHLPKGSGEVVRVIGGTSLGPRERVVVVEVDETRLVLGVAPGRVQTLHVLDRKESKQEDFAGQLNHELQGGE